MFIILLFHQIKLIQNVESDTFHSYFWKTEMDPKLLISGNNKDIYYEMWEIYKTVNLRRKTTRNLRDLFRPAIRAYHKKYMIQLSTHYEIIYVKSYDTRIKATEELTKILTKNKY